MFDLIEFYEYKSEFIVSKNENVEKELINLQSVDIAGCPMTFKL